MDSNGKKIGKASSAVGATGSGSRPGGGKTTTPTSAPADQHGLGRMPPGSLK